MKCDKCGMDLTPVQPKYTSPSGTDVITCTQTLLCTNIKCVWYAGIDLNNPKQIAMAIDTEVK